MSTATATPTLIDPTDTAADVRNRILEAMSTLDTSLITLAQLAGKNPQVLPIIPRVGEVIAALEGISADWHEIAPRK